MSCITDPLLLLQGRTTQCQCDIEQAYIHADNKILLNLLFTNPSDTLVNVQSDQTNIEFTMRPFAALTKQAPIFRLTPASDHLTRKWKPSGFLKRTCNIYSYFRRQAMEPHLSGKHQEGTDHHAKTRLNSNLKTHTSARETTRPARELRNGNKLDIWATGNSGFQMSNSSSKPEEYPTVMIEDGHKGKGVQAHDPTHRRVSADVVTQAYRCRQPLHRTV